VAQGTEKLEVLNAIVCAIPVLVLELERHRLVHPRDDSVAFREVVEGEKNHTDFSNFVCPTQSCHKIQR